MPTLPSPEPAQTVALRIDSDNPAAELFLLDPQLELVARGIGSLETRQVPGVYKIRVRLGRDSRDELILLNADQREVVKAPKFASPAPLGDTALTHEYHIAAAEQCSKQPTVSVGTGSSIFLFIRYFTAPGRTSRAQENPARDFRLATLGGETVVDAASKWITGAPPDAWAACYVQLAPGTYVLEQETSSGRLCHAIVASPDWQTQVFLVRSQLQASPGDAGNDPAPAGAFEMGTVLMSRGPFVSDSSDSRLTELARIALADDRSILGETLHSLLLQKFVNPMQGMFGAHLMLRARDRKASPRRPVEAAQGDVPAPEPPFDASLFDTVIRNLRQLVGPNHPDVEALSLQCADPALQTTTVFSSPPMLRRSWSLIVAASNDRADIFDEQLWDRVMARTVTAPFFSWLSNTESVRSEYQESIRAVVGDRARILESSAPPRDAGGGASEAVLARTSNWTRAANEFPRRLSEDLDVPRSVIEKMIRER